MARPRKVISKPIVWGEFVFVPAAASRFGEDVLVLDRERGPARLWPGCWPLGDVLRALGVNARGLALRYEGLGEGDDAPLSRAEIEAWIALTTRVARRYQYAGLEPAIMEALVAEVIRTSAWPTRVTHSSPQSVRAETDFRLSATFWCMNELRRAAGMRGADFWQRWLGTSVPAVYRKHHNVAERCKRFEWNLIVSKRSEVMRDIIAGAIEFVLRPGSTPMQETHATPPK